MEAQGGAERSGGTSGGSETLSSLLAAGLAILRRRWRMLLGVSSVFFALGVAVILMITPRFEAVARVKIDPTPGAANGQISDRPLNPDQSIVDTEASVMRSRDIALAVAERLRLTEDPEFVGEDAEPATTVAARAARLDAAAGRLLSSLSTTREKATYVIDIGFQSTNAHKAAQIANAFAQTYIEYSLGRRTGTARLQSDYLDQQLNVARSRASALDARLAQFRAATGVTATAGTSATDQQVASIASQLATAESEAAAARSNLVIAQRQIGNGGISAVSAVLSSNVIAALRGQRATLMQTYGEVQTRYGAKHPESLKIQQQLQSIDQQISDEAGRVIGGLESEANAASARAASLRADMNRLRGQQSSASRASVTADSLSREAEAARTTANQLAQQAQTSDAASRSSMSQAQIVENATPPEKPTKPKKTMLFGMNLALALLAGFGTVVLQELSVAGLRTAHEVERFGLPVLASVPLLTNSQLRADSGRLTPADTLIEHPMTFYAEAFRVARRGIMRDTGKPPRVVALVSTLPDEGKSTSALSLARVMALAGERTVVVDCDLRRAGLSRLTGQAGEPGLIEVLCDGIDPATAVRPDAISGLDVLGVSAASFLAADLFSDDRMRNLIIWLRQHYDNVVLDTPPLLGVADARAIALLADSVLMTIRWGKTPPGAIKTGLAWLRQDNASLAGVLLTMAEPTSESFGALYYSRKYAAYYQTS